MKTLLAALALFLLLFTTSAAFADNNGPRIDTDKTKYADGEPITFTGENWSPGEVVTIVYGQDGDNDKATIEVTADNEGSFTATGTMKVEEGGSPNYKATATGSISHGSASVQYREGEREVDGDRLLDSEPYWFHRLTFPTGKFDPGWVKHAADQDKNVPRGTPKGKKKNFSLSAMSVASGNKSILSLNASSFTALGPRPERMTGCSGCFDYGLTQGRVNSIAIDPTTTSPGNIVAYIGTVGGGVWKTTNCCSTTTTWTILTDDPLVSTTSIDSVTIDPNDHNTIYAGTGDLNYGSFSMGSQGILKSTDAGAHWTVLGSDVFGAALPLPPNSFPQYQAVGKVRVDPNNSNRVVAGTKTGLYLSYDGGVNWTGPCLTNAFTTQRQDITGLELTNVSGATRILAAIGVRGFASTVQFNLNNNGANGLYRGTLPASGCPTDFVPVSTNANGFVFGTAVTGSPYTTGASMNGTSGSQFVSTASGNQLGRMDIAVAPSNPNVIYAQVQSIAPNNNSGCGNANGCQLGLWSSTNGGNTWTFMTGSAGGSLRNCAGGNTSSNPGDYPQNWYDQGLAVDPTNADRLFVDTYDTWFATRTGTSLFNITCGYNGSALANHVVHVDHHALAFVPGSNSILLEGSDGGIFSTSNAQIATSATPRPTWVNMDTGLNTIEFYSGDISANFANSATPQANGGAQDNGSSSVTLAPNPSGPVQWQMGAGGDGFFARIDPLSTRMFQGNNNGSINRCTTNCTNSGASWSGFSSSTMLADQQSFILPFEIFKGTPGNPATDCSATTCNHMIAGTIRVWETINSFSGASSSWYVNSPANLTKGTLGNRSFINQLAYSPASSTLAVVGTNDGNVQLGRNLGTGSNQAIWVNVTGGNATLPNRPVLDVTFDPTITATTPPVAYAAVGGFDENTPTTTGHVFRVACTTITCTSFSWQNKTGNLPNVPVDSIIANPKYPPQVFAGTDFGLYYTDDITANPPSWLRFNNGLPNVMIWDMQIDRGGTTLSLWTRSRGAYVWPLPQGPENPLPTILASASASGTYGGTATLSATLSSGGNVIAGKLVTFTINGNAAGSAITDGGGVATVANASIAGINAGTFGTAIAASFAGDDIYAAASDDSSLTVGPLAITVSAVADSKTFDGNTASSASPSIAPALIAGDTSGFTQSFDTRNAGTNKTLTATGAVNDGNGGNNYAVTFVSNTNGEIVPKALIGSITAGDKVYDGTTAATILTRTLSGVIAPDVVSYIGGSATFSDANVGTGKTVTATGLSLSGANAGNYTVNSTATTTANIVAASAGIIVNGYTGVYDGLPHGASGSATGVNGEDLTALLDFGASFTNVPGGVANWTFAGNINYAPVSGTASIVITKALLTVTANNASRLYSQPNPTFTAGYAGFQNGETLTTSGVTGAPSLTTTASSSSAPGLYVITAAAGTLASGNYSFAFVNGTLTVYLSGIVGLDSVFIGSTKAIADSFDSNGGYASTHGSSALVLSNGTIDVSGANVAGDVASSHGSVIIRPGGVVTGNVTAGTTITNQGTIGGVASAPAISDAIVAPAVAPCGPYTANPSISGGSFSYSNGALSVNGGASVTLAAGTYCFSSLSLKGGASLHVDGPVSISVTGAIDAAGGSFVNTTQRPSNLQITSSYSGNDGVSIAGGTDAYMTVYAPATGVSISGGSPVFGALLGKTLKVNGNSQVHYDVLLPNVWSALLGF